MSRFINSAGGFTGYEYTEVTVPRNMESVYRDGYGNFGWQAEGSLEGMGFTRIRFKRDRKIVNKMELTRLQRQFDSCIHQIDSLERSKSTGASIAAYSAGLGGCAFLAGSVFAFQAGMIPLCVILSIPGFAGWIAPYFLYRKIGMKKTAAVTQLIEGKYDEMYEVCEKAHGLLAVQ